MSEDSYVSEKYEKVSTYVCKSVVEGCEHRFVKRIPRRDHESPPASIDEIAFSIESRFDDE
jgi:hypothetical protein